MDCGGSVRVCEEQQAEARRCFREPGHCLFCWVLSRLFVSTTLDNLGLTFTFWVRMLGAIAQPAI